MTLHDMLNEAIKYDDAFLAYSILWASQNGIPLNAPYDDLIQKGINISEVRQLALNDTLGILKVKLYTTKHDDGCYHLVLAENPQDAQTELLKRTGTLYRNFSNITKNMDEYLYDPQTRKFESIREIKNKAIKMPHYIGLYEKE